MPKEHPYSFDAYLKIRDAFNDYLDNPFVHRHCNITLTKNGLICTPN